MALFKIVVWAIIFLTKYMITVHDSEFNFALPKPNTNSKKKSFSYRGAEAWNGLSSDLKSAKSIFSFKTKINCL